MRGDAGVQRPDPHDRRCQERSRARQPGRLVARSERQPTDRGGGERRGSTPRYHNIAAHPDQVQIEVDGRRIRVTAEQLHGAERAEAWRQIAAATPRFAQYQRKTDRELPIIRLIPPSG